MVGCRVSQPLTLSSEVKNFVADVSGFIRSALVPHHFCCWNRPIEDVADPSGFVTPLVSPVAVADVDEAGLAHRGHDADHLTAPVNAELLRGDDDVGGVDELLVLVSGDRACRDAGDVDLRGLGLCPARWGSTLRRWRRRSPSYP